MIESRNLLSLFFQKSIKKFLVVFGDSSWKQGVLMIICNI